jgi:SAM-dependent methyltransferase
MGIHCSHTGKPLKKGRRTGEAFAWSDEGVLYSLQARSLSYEDDYFLADYERTYGRSYEEDESNLRNLARRRLHHLKSFTGKDHGRLLEIGCAAGYFLDEARKSGFDVTGIEISSWGCNLTRKKGLRVVHSSFLEPTAECEALFLNERFDVIAAFYVIEHFADQRKVFETISSLLMPGGFFLCALPSIHGPLFKYDFKKWKETHPADHYVDYSPCSLRRILPLYNLRALRFFPASYHQERCRGLLKHLPSGLYRWYADRTAYGDTIEFIAQKLD